MHISAVRVSEYNNDVAVEMLPFAEVFFQWLATDENVRENKEVMLAFNPLL